MGFKIGVVCEGSHDFNVLRHFVSLIVREYGETLDVIECLQPEVSATFQITGGGWTQVKAWCKRNGGRWYRQYLDQPLFASSKKFDILIIHLDGDVVTHCDSDPLAELSIDGMSVEEVIEALKSAVLQSWLNLEDQHQHRVVVAVPVRHLEAWLSAVVGPKVNDPESIDMKDLFRDGPAKAIAGRDWRQKYIKAAQHSIAGIAEVRHICLSYRIFEGDVRASADAV